MTQNRSLQKYSS